MNVIQSTLALLLGGGLLVAAQSAQAQVPPLPGVSPMPLTTPAAVNTPAPMVTLRPVASPSPTATPFQPYNSSPTPRP